MYTAFREFWRGIFPGEYNFFNIICEVL
jgi:hypothetical protein